MKRLIKKPNVFTFITELCFDALNETADTELQEPRQKCA